MYINQEKAGQIEGTENVLSDIVGEVFRKKTEQYQPILLFGSIGILLLYFFDALYAFEDGNGKILHALNMSISILFMGDIIYRYTLAINKKQFFKRNWFYFLLSVPFYPLSFQVMTFGLRSTVVILEYVMEKVHTAFKAMLVLCLSLIVWASISIIQFEIPIETSNIKSLGDGVWWSLCTITTIGYGDRFPVTFPGRSIAGVLMITGIGLYGTVVGYISAYFSDREKGKNNKVDTIEELSEQVAKLRDEISRMNEAELKRDTEEAERERKMNETLECLHKLCKEIRSGQS